LVHFAWHLALSAVHKCNKKKRYHHLQGIEDNILCVWPLFYQTC